ncbi:hypothetical protein A6R68_01561 [Neotoma lepida]|uniref:Uncharacterized protein n=1 Tax=Neotoma lepida TaxID=56216 RepID=A0A1A6GX22_NEOLE|nr:hypothetical protein A6R68_01561 [Neotoma lepida]
MDVSSNSDASSSYGNVQNGNSYMFEASSRQTDNSSDVRDASQVHTHNSDLSFMPTANAASGNGDLFSVTYLRSILSLSSISAALPSQNNPGSSTVIISKHIKDPRLVKREQSMRKKNNSAGFPVDAVNNCSDATCFKFSYESSHCQTHNMGSKDYGCTASSKIAITEQCKEQNSFTFPCYLPNVCSDVGKQKYNEENAQRAQKEDNIPVLTEQSNKSQTSCESGKNTPSFVVFDLKAVYKDGYALFPVQKKRSLNEYMQNTGMMGTFISPEDSSKHVVKQISSKETVNFMNKTKSSPIENCITLHEEHKECEILNPLRGNCEKIPVTHKLQMPTSPISTTEDANEPDHAALELGCNLSPNTESLSQKHPQYSLEHKGNIHTDFALARGLIELKAVQNNQNFINITKQLIDRVISSSAIDVSLDSSGCDIVGECMYIQRENENEAVSLYNLQKDFRGSSHINDDEQDHSLSSDAELSSHLSLKVNLQEQRDNGNPTEAKDKDIWGKKGRPAKTASTESEDSMAAIKQRHAPNDGRSVEHLVSTFPEMEGLVKHGISDGEIDTGKDKLQDLHQLVNENSVLQSFELGSEIEVELECNDASLFQQDMHSHGNVLCEEFELYEALKSRIDWEGLFGNSNEEMDTSSFARREGTDPHHSTDSNCISFPSQKDKRELHSPVLLPDLQLKDSFYKHVTEPTEPEANKEKAFGFSIYSQPSGENSGFSCENKFGNSVQESGHVSKSGLSYPSNSSHNTHMSHISGKPDSDSLSTLPSNVTVINDKSKCPKKPKPDFDDNRNKKDMESRSSKRNVQASSRGQNIPHNLREHETHEKRTRHDS